MLEGKDFERIAKLLAVHETVKGEYDQEMQVHKDSVELVEIVRQTPEVLPIEVVSSISTYSRRNCCKSSR